MRQGQHQSLETCGNVWHGAGQAIVQIARSPTSGLEYAIKFFASEAAYKVETGIYRREDGVHSSDLVQFLPQVCIVLFDICQLLRQRTVECRCHYYC